MPTNKAGYTVEYAKKKLKRIPLDVHKEYYDEVLAKISEHSGMSINGFIKAAITEKIKRDGINLPIDKYNP